MQGGGDSRLRGNDVDRGIYGLGAIHTSEQGTIYADESNGAGSEAVLMFIVQPARTTEVEDFVARESVQEAHFTEGLFEFLIDLRMNNDREWFRENKRRYDRDVKEPLLRFIEDFEPRLHSVSAHFVADARANGGSMFRIYRDVRFSRDKSPYKTQAAAHFRHEAGKTAHAPGFYLHLSPDEVYAGVGIWQPDSESLARIRNAIDADPGKWERAAKDEAFLREFTIGGDSLKRPPKGFGADHPYIQDLKRKDHIASVEFEREDVVAPGFIDDFADVCRQASPYMRFLTSALGLPY